MKHRNYQSRELTALELKRVTGMLSAGVACDTIAERMRVPRNQVVKIAREAGLLKRRGWRE